MTEQSADNKNDKGKEAPVKPVKKKERPLQLTSDNSRWIKLRRRLLRLVGDILLTKTTCKCTVTGLEYVPRSGPTMVLFNHVNIVDPIMAGAFIKFRDPIPIGKAELSRGITSLIVKGWDSIPLHRGELDITALRRAIIALESSDFLEIAPEGTRNKEGLGKPKEGFVMLTAKTNAMMVPCGVSGSEYFFDNIRRLRRTPVRIVYGKPLRLKGKITRSNYEAVADEVMYQLAGLIDPHLRGLYSDLSRASMNFLEYA